MSRLDKQEWDGGCGLVEVATWGPGLIRTLCGLLIDMKKVEPEDFNTTVKNVVWQIEDLAEDTENALNRYYEELEAKKEGMKNEN